MCAWLSSVAAADDIPPIILSCPGDITRGNLGREHCRRGLLARTQGSGQLGIHHGHRTPTHQETSSRSAPALSATRLPMVSGNSVTCAFDVSVVSKYQWPASPSHPPLLVYIVVETVPLFRKFPEIRKFQIERENFRKKLISDSYKTIKYKGINLEQCFCKTFCQKLAFRYLICWKY